MILLKNVPHIYNSLGRRYNNSRRFSKKITTVIAASYHVRSTYKILKRNKPQYTNLQYTQECLRLICNHVLTLFILRSFICLYLPPFRLTSKYLLRYEYTLFQFEDILQQKRKIKSIVKIK